MESPAKTFIAKFAESLRDRTFVRLTLSRPAPEGGSERVVGRLVDIKNRPNLSITARDGKRDITKNLAL